jgi:hypothetical protein
VSFKRFVRLDKRVEILTANELQLLADMNLELADQYERGAPYMENEEGRRIALVLSRWRRRRGRDFRQLSAEAERTEATHMHRARSLLGVSANPISGFELVPRRTPQG